ncbi:hypothetical protein AAH991_05395 [Microbispora sp. ZYX-F-249]|uniref:CBM2 domain-containing protein n=1 Tax=Microbispora maris TaxID=3144104 RepID=A0ABV0AJ20_9ACTN
MGRHTAGRKAREGQPSPAQDGSPESTADPDHLAFRPPATPTGAPPAPSGIGHPGPRQSGGDVPWPVPPADTPGNGVPWPAPPSQATGGGVPWPAPPSDATTRMFTALSPERLESESLASPERPVTTGRPVTPGGAGGRGLPAPGRDDLAKQPRRMRRLALVSGLSVLLAVGVTTGGARLIAGRTSLTMEQPTTACPVSEDCTAAGAPGSGQALGETRAPGDPAGDPVQNGRDQPGREDAGRTGAGQDDARSTGKDDTGKNDTGKNAAKDDGPKNDTGKDTARGGSADPRATPVSTATSGGPDRDHASARTRTPSTAAPRASSTAAPRVGDAPAAVTAAGDNTAATVPGDSGNGEDTAGTDTAGTDTAQTESALAGDGAAVRVRFTMTRHDESGYTARLAVRNEGPALPAWTIRLAVGGQVTAVEGADWKQRGDTLTLSSQTALDEGGALTLTVHADGASAAPADCVLSEGRCEVTGPGRSRRHA